MENCWEEKKSMVDLEPLLDDNSDEKGGFRTLPFIIGNEALEKMATFGLMPNMTIYLMKEFHMEMSTASNVLFFWSAATNFMPLVGAIIADSYLGRFYTIGFGSVICLMGMILLWSTTIIPQARPPPCDLSSTTCSSPTIFQFVYLCASLGLISIGAGGIRSSSLAFGVNQLEKGGYNKKCGVKESYFSWYYASYTLSVLIALTCVVYIQDTMGWAVGYAVPAVLMSIGVVSFFLASRFYVKLRSRTNLVTGFVQVVVASYRNRHLKFSDGTNYVWHSKNTSALVFPSEKFRFLNNACIIRDSEKDLTPDGRAKDPWSLCTMDQVEELKSLLGVIPIWSTGMIMSINMSQNSFPVLQAVSMDRRITSSFVIPAASFSTFAVIAVILWALLYDRVFLPLASRSMGRPVRLSTRTRMGLGIFLSFLAMIVSAMVETTRRALAINEGYLDHPLAGVHMSAMWLVPQNCLMGFAEASNAIAQNEFYFSEFPRSMSSIAATLNGIGVCMANLLASLIMNSVDSISKARGDESWISSNINKGHYDYYNLVLAGLSLCNMVYFFVCSSAYGPLREERDTEEQEDY
ncbi:hypothetical protein BUALT_Bualt05G0016200 [Buddleja alternifolia]|uniref:Protein NRT1/ PTR FAMILY 1.2-like n=1 Tax=Buddleja alternifolia TaxID=168488 RepID=A0AAV6XMQ9_9LAMI|nr:hypothetical protein BUALT_Bualt05G0016200 [Buddleja alternifolia]